MQQEVKQILEIIKKKEKKEQENIILECASKIGTTEWQRRIKELIKKIEE